jgi:selenide,water dikinase
MKEDIRLTQFAKGAGCGCKIAPAVLESILSANRTSIGIDENLLVGNQSNDDAAVYDLKNGSALLVTADFFMPIVDDPFEFGKIAAANAISDIYAMGGKPITAIALLGWPIDKIAAEHASAVMQGAKEICAEAGIVISGGHTIDSAEPFFGLSVNGLVAINDIKRNSTAEAGNVILMTKKIGVGILSTAQKRSLISNEDKDALVKQLCELNTFGEVLGKESSVKAMTDVTGFGLLGHLTEMTEAANLSAEINFSEIPVLEECRKYIDQNVVPDACYRNWNAYNANIQIEASVDPKASFMLLPDPQTNGGLLIAVEASSVEHIKQLAIKNGVEIKEIGKFVEKSEKIIYVN